MPIRLRDTESSRTLLKIVGPNGETTCMRKNALCKLLTGLGYEYKWNESEVVVFLEGTTIELETGSMQGGNIRPYIN